MADFNQALPFTLKNEGGLQALPYDRGNQQADSSLSHTNRGITLATLTTWRRQKGTRLPTDADVVALSDADTAAIYQDLYWRPLSAGQIADQALATVLFDAGVLCGVTTSARLLQTVVAGFGQPMLCDGQIGPKTLAALAATPTRSALHLLIDRHSDRFADIVLSDSSQAPALSGWRSRRSRWRALALS